MVVPRIQRVMITRLVAGTVVRAKVNRYAEGIVVIRPGTQSEVGSGLRVALPSCPCALLCACAQESPFVPAKEFVIRDKECRPEVLVIIERYSSHSESGA